MVNGAIMSSTKRTTKEKNHSLFKNKYFTTFILKSDLKKARTNAIISNRHQQRNMSIYLKFISIVLTYILF